MRRPSVSFFPKPLPVLAGLLLAAGCQTGTGHLVSREEAGWLRAPAREETALFETLARRPEAWENWREALATSRSFLVSSAARRRYPVAGVRRAEVLEALDILEEALGRATPGERAALLEAGLDLWELPGEGLFTAYYAPEFDGSLVPGGPYRWPLYRRPPGWRGRGPTRREIEEGRLLIGHEIVWLRDPFDAFVIHVNGSARIRLPDGGHRNLGHDGTNERPYTSLGRLMLERGLLRGGASLQAMRAWAEAHPREFQELLLENDRFVYFTFVDDADWPRGAVGRLTPRRSAAADISLYPPGAPLVLELDDGRTPLVFHHDVGGAILGPGRADWYLGVGEAAGEEAGRFYRRGRMLLLLPGGVPRP